MDYRALLSDTTCATADTSFTAPYVQGSLAAGSVGDCYVVNLPSGSVLSYAITGELILFFDATGVQICNGTGDCTLTGTAPYRVTVSEPYGGTTASTYTLRLNSLTNPQGCEVVSQQIYGQVPDSTSTDRCRSITVATAGSYQIYEAGGLASNVTATHTAAGGYVTVYPDGAPRPTVSNLNFSAGETIPNLVVVPVVNGKVDFYNGSAGNVQVVADVAGYFSS